MSNVENIRSSLISKILAIKNQEVLEAIDKLLTASLSGEKVDVTEEQKLMLQISEEDIKYGRTISQEDLFSKEREWLNEQ